MDKIIMQGLQFYAFHGAMLEEECLGQKFIVDLEMQLDLAPAGETDDLQQTVSYAEIYQVVKAMVTEKRFRLIEALAEAIAQAVLNGFAIEGVLVRIKKPQAPVPGIFDYMAVEINRQKKK